MHENGISIGAPTDSGTEGVMTTESVKKITASFRIPRDLMQKARQKAEAEDRSLNSLVVHGLRSVVMPAAGSAKK